MKLESFKYFFPEKPRLITTTQSLFTRVSDDPSWVAEYKYNENRLQLHNVDGFEFWDRHNSKLSYRPTDEIMDNLSDLDLPKGYNLFDGGLRHNKVVGVKNKIMFYDVFIWDGELLLGMPFKERRKIVEGIVAPGAEPLGTPVQFGSDFQTHYDNVMEDPEIEGLVIKNEDGVLDLSRSAGRDSTWMLKVRKATGRHRF